MVPSFWFGLFDPSMRGFLQLPLQRTGGFWDVNEKGPIIFFIFLLQGNRVATFNGQKFSQRGTKESFLVIVEIVEMQQIFASKNLKLATVYDFSLKASVIGFSFLYC